MSWLGETDAASGAVRLSDRHGDFRRSCSSSSSSRRSARAASIRGFIGRRSSPRPPAGRRSPISPTARSGSAIPAARCCCFACVLLSLFAWHRTLGTVNVNTVTSPPAKRPSTGSPSPSRRRSAPRSATGPPTPSRWRLGPRLRRRRVGLRRRPRAARDRSISRRRSNRVGLFWAAFILTRPLGATVGDFLDKPLDKGGLELEPPARLGGAGGRRSSP